MPGKAHGFNYDYFRGGQPAAPHVVPPTPTTSTNAPTIISKDIANGTKRKFMGMGGFGWGLIGAGTALTAMYGVGKAMQASVMQVRNQNRNWDRNR